MWECTQSHEFMIAHHPVATKQIELKWPVQGTSEVPTQLIFLRGWSITLWDAVCT